MGEVDSFSETSAVHLRIEDDKGNGEQGEEGLESHRCSCCRLSPYSGYQGRAYECLGEGQQGAEDFRGESEESDMQEIEILIHHKPGTDRVQELEDA